MNKDEITEQRNKILKINTYIFTYTYQPSNCNHGCVETTINIRDLSRPVLKRNNAGYFDEIISTQDVKSHNNCDILYSCYQK